jgi:DnaJ family protein C protein 17
MAAQSEENINWYEILNCSINSSKEQISKAARKLSLVYHPDKNPDPEAAKIFLNIQKAKDFLLDEEKRKDYDQKIRNVIKRKEYDSQRSQNMDSKRKKMKEELEARLSSALNEKDKTKQSRNNEQPSSSSKYFPDFDKLPKHMKEEIEKSAREEKERQRKEGDILQFKKNIGMCQIKIKWKRTRQSHSDETLYQLFKEFGEISEVVLIGDKGNSAIITFKSESSAKSAFEKFIDAEDMRVTVVDSNSGNKKPASIFSHSYEKKSSQIDVEDFINKMKSQKDFASTKRDETLDVDESNFEDGDDLVGEEELKQFFLLEKQILTKLLFDLNVEETDKLFSNLVYK